MTRLLNIGSINIDYVYQVPHFLRAGETLEASKRAIFMGGKGLNQSVAAKRSGLEVIHLGVLGADGTFLRDFMQTEGIDVRFLRTDNTLPTGHTVIQVTPDAENAILYFAGTNHAIDRELVREALRTLETDDFVLMQNEVNDVGFCLTEAKKQGLVTIFNPAPYSPEVLSYPLENVDVLIVNETEARGILDADLADDDEILKSLRERFPHAAIFLTLGKKGMKCDLKKGFAPMNFDAFKVKAVDTTGAGDTFVGYAVRALMAYRETKDIKVFKKEIETAMLAAATSVTREGAVPSIPKINDLTLAAKTGD